VPSSSELPLRTSTQGLFSTPYTPNFGALLDLSDKGKGKASFLVRPLPSQSSIVSPVEESRPSSLGSDTKPGFARFAGHSTFSQAPTKSAFDSTSNSNSDSTSQKGIFGSTPSGLFGPSPSGLFGSIPSNKPSDGAFFGSPLGKTSVNLASSNDTSFQLNSNLGAGAFSSSNSLFPTSPQADKSKGSFKGKPRSILSRKNQDVVHIEATYEGGQDHYQTITALPAFRDHSLEVSKLCLEVDANIYRLIRSFASMTYEAVHNTKGLSLSTSIDESQPNVENSQFYWFMHVVLHKELRYLYFAISIFISLEYTSF
jgi:hypothetical protein